MKNSRMEMEQLSYRNDKEAGLSIDVAVIGGGISGLYAGYRLLSGTYGGDSQPPESIHILKEMIELADGCSQSNCRI